MNPKLENVLENFKNKTAKKCYKITLLDETPSITDSKIGGNPYLPLGKNYPKDKNGDDMPLLIQINFADIHLDNYPDKGILQIFVDKNLDYPSDYKVIYHSEINNNYITDFPEIDLSNFIVNEEIKIALEPNITYMPLGDYRFDETFKSLFNVEFNSNINNIFDIDDLIGKGSYDEFLNELNIEPGLVGGYADFTQTDPRTFENEDFTECIIKLDSMLDYDRIFIGDSGIAWLLITPKDLKNKDFDKSSFDWDCC